MAVTPSTDVRVPWNKGILGRQEWMNISGLGKNIDYKKRGKSISKSMIGIKRSERYKKSKSELMKKKWNDPEYRKMILDKRYGRMNPWNKGKSNPFATGNKSHFWKGGVTPVNHQIRNSFRYVAWRKAVFERDNYTCQMCGVRGGDLEVDHYPQTFSQIINTFKIKSIEEAILCDALWDTKNNRTLCVKCHKITPSYMNPKFYKGEICL